MKRETVLEKQQDAPDQATEHADRSERNGPQTGTIRSTRVAAEETGA
jgi:hypothetical protein